MKNLTPSQTYNNLLCSRCIVLVPIICFLLSYFLLSYILELPLWNGSNPFLWIFSFIHSPFFYTHYIDSLYFKTTAKSDIGLLFIVYGLSFTITSIVAFMLWRKLHRPVLFALAVFSIMLCGRYVLLLLYAPVGGIENPLIPLPDKSSLMAPYFISVIYGATLSILLLVYAIMLDKSKIENESNESNENKEKFINWLYILSAIALVGDSHTPMWELFVSFYSPSGLFLRSILITLLACVAMVMNRKIVVKSIVLWPLLVLVIFELELLWYCLTLLIHDFLGIQLSPYSDEKGKVSSFFILPLVLIASIAIPIQIGWTCATENINESFIATGGGLYYKLALIGCVNLTLSKVTYVSLIVVWAFWSKLRGMLSSLFTSMRSA